MAKLSHAAAAVVSLVILGAPTIGHADDSYYFFVEGFSGDTITLLRYHTQVPDRSTIGVSKYIKLSPQVANLLPTMPNRVVNTTNQLDSFIIDNGLGEIIGAGAPASLVKEEADAKAHGRGMWPEPILPCRPSSDNCGEHESWILTLLGFGKSAVSYWRELVALGFVGGVFSFLIRWVHRRFFVKRRVNLSVIGMKGSGKTAVLRRFNNPHLTEQDVTKSEPSTASTTFNMRTHVRIGPYEVFGQLRDIPGEMWGEFHRSLSVRSRFGTNIALFVLAPTDQKDATAKNWKREAFVDEQIGFAKGTIVDCLAASGNRKPDLVIIFLNKFDLVSEQNSDDSSSPQKVLEFKNLFKSLLNLSPITLHERPSPRPIVRVVVGSALKDWGNKEIISAIDSVLDMGAH